MKILICYFSGTGNTKKVIDCFSECFTKEYNDEVTLVRMEDEFNLDVNEFDLVGIGYPVHAFNAPSIVLNFCKKLPKLKNGKKAFIVNTSGEPLKLNNISSIKTVQILKKRNIEVTNEYHYCMPYNIIFRHGDEMAYRMWRVVQLVAPLDARQLRSGEGSKLKPVFMGGFIAWIMRCEHWGGRLNGKQYKVNENCVNCNKCINICPTRNITIKNGKIRFGNNCLMCMRCAHLCSKDAIKIGWFNKWKVNGAYSFKKPKSPDTKSYNRMLTRAYKKYFDENNMRIAMNYPSVILKNYDDKNAAREYDLNESEAAAANAEEDYAFNNN
ncbi:MAG: EFR1 family ferrodoxin [Corallococcus sp.]|nr:EFR1 family ferrodoxin [Bacillota bacterium]MCM1533211.1 EFR1 family ferrodoxin [Corallococcus sp.]